MGLRESWSAGGEVKRGFVDQADQCAGAGGRELSETSQGGSGKDATVTSRK